MSLRINNNIASLNGHRNMLKNDMAVSSSLEKLSSGLRINKAADDAAGLVISEQMRAQIAGINQAIDNSETAISMVQTAEGALDEVNSLLNKARELVLHAANDGANDATQLAADQAELDNVLSSINRISEVTQFGTKKLLDGSLDGSTNLSSGITRVNAGNLANNAAVATGSVTIATTGLTLESHSLAGITSGTDDAHIFGTTGISGIEELVSGTVVNSGTVVKVTIDGTDYSATVSGGGATVSTMLGKINTQLTNAGLNFTASAASGGGINIGRTTADSTDYTSSITFTRSSGTTAVNAQASALIQNVNGSGGNNATATAIFGETSLANVTSGSQFLAAGTIVQGQLSYSGGTVNSINYVSTGGATLQTALNAIQADVVALGNGLSGSTVSYTATGAGLTVAIDSNNVALEKMTFSLEIDLPNNDSFEEEMAAFRLDTIGGAGATGNAAEEILFTDSGVGTGLDAVAAVANVSLASGTIMNLDIDGQSFTVSGANGGTAIATALTTLQGQLDIAFGANTIRVAAHSGVAGGDTLFNMNLTGAAVGGTSNTDVAAAGFNIFVARNDNSTQSLTGVTISFENSLLTGTDIIATNTHINDGSGVKASTYNLDTASGSQVALSGVTAHALATLGSTGSTITSGTDGVSATLTTANGVSLTLVSSGSASTGAGASLVLSSATGNAGFQGIRIGIDGATTAASTSSLSFDLNDGAIFQVGANAGQTVGLTIGDLDVNELGRDVTDSGTLTSLNDLLSTEQNALTNGLADEALRVIDSAIDEITSMRGDLGAFQANTLETGLNSLRVSGENLTAAESTIRDVDFAAESARFTRNNIMIQASTAMLAQANQLPQNVLQLLG